MFLSPSPDLYASADHEGTREIVGALVPSPQAFTAVNAATVCR
jgi:hypothetical protein